ncbi:unnamed protein product [Clonostachys byssicola]|uniref:tRNA ligase n=1 Tax=Clonostachys byssicola TaxID=160290 RepID=A0A9N9U3B0_9HYPO|nr:unnamed protein product [Clonostachys byssicola]
MDTAPYIAQDPEEVKDMIFALEQACDRKKKGGFSCKKTSFHVKDSPTGLKVDSWKMHDWDYKRRDLPTYARGLFTSRLRNGNKEISVRGYDKFFNTDEVEETKWPKILTRTKAPYELTLKENGCIIFIAGLEDDTLIVCSKHSTGDRGDVDLSHASAGERLLEKQLATLGKTKVDLARELRKRNITAVAELCDDSFEEHILAYGPEKAGLYLHGINLNLPKFATYPSAAVQEFADLWGFVKTGLIVMDDINEVKTFLEQVAETGAHDGRDVEGFVIRTKMTHHPDVPARDWFFKYKFEEPYLMYRQWRECTKALINGKMPKIRKHVKITEEYLLYAKRRLAKDPKLGKDYNKNHGIIALRDDFLKFKNLNGSDAANMDELDTVIMPNVTKDVIINPIATIGCGKTTLALALEHLFGWGHVQNDNISGKGRPPRFVKAVLGQLKNHPVVFADRNNASKHERKQILDDVKSQHKTAKMVCFSFRHDEDTIEEIRRVTQERVIERGDNHQTIHISTDKDKFIGVMESFLNRFEPCTPHVRPDDGFDVVIELDPTLASRENLETAVVGLKKYFPDLIGELPTAEQYDAAMEHALGYRPDFKHNIPDRGKNKKDDQKGQQAPAKKNRRSFEYMSVAVPSQRISVMLDKAFQNTDPETSRFYMQLKQTRRVQAKFHVTLLHRAMSKEYPELWEKYSILQKWGEDQGKPEDKVGICDVMLERVVFDDRIMAIVVRISDEHDEWKCVNRVAHITVGTRDSTVKPKESNDLLAKWLDEGITEGNKIKTVVFEEKPTVVGEVKPVLSIR